MKNNFLGKNWGMLAFLVGIGCNLCAKPLPTNAADQVIVRFSAIEQSISVKELRTFVDSQKQSPTITAILEKVNLKPNAITAILSMSFDIKEFDLSVALVDRLLNTFAAEVALREIGRAIRSPASDSASVQAIRGAIITSLADDGKISAIEFLEKYPTDLLVEGNVLQELLGRVFKDVQDLREPVTRILQKTQKR